MTQITQSRKFDLYGEDVNIDRVVTVLGELSPDIRMNGAIRTSEATIIRFEAPVAVYTSIFGAVLIERECTYLNCPDHTSNKNYLETTVSPQLPEKLKPYVSGVVDADNHKTQTEIDLLNQLMNVFKP